MRISRILYLFHCNSTYAGSDLVSIYVVHVRVSHKQSKIVINTYASLDSCSQGTFVTEEVLREMNLKAKGTTITVNTLNGEATENSKIIEGLEVSNSSDHGNEFLKWLRLPESYTKKDIPVGKDGIIKPDQLSQWKYVGGIKGELCDKKDIKISLLTGANCDRALEPEVVIPTKDVSPTEFPGKV